MTVNRLEAAMRRALNDRRIFWMPQELIARAEWSKFREAVFKDNRGEATEILDLAETRIMKRINDEQDNRKRGYLENARALLIGLKTHFCQSSVMVRDVVCQLDAFGPLRCNLPNMEDFGRVIENHSRMIAEQFFLYRIQKEKDKQRRDALTGLLEIVKGLYEQHLEPLEIAFFVRKLDSFTQIVEVLK